MVASLTFTSYALFHAGRPHRCAPTRGLLRRWRPLRPAFHVVADQPGSESLHVREVVRHARRDVQEVTWMHGPRNAVANDAGAVGLHDLAAGPGHGFAFRHQPEVGGVDVR